MPASFDRFAPVLIGTAIFLLATGGLVLLPANIAWLDHGDPRQHYLGWAFFRESPWQLPLGLNPNFGLELSSAVVFSDSLPLLAIPFKALAPLLPDVFQYFGFWVLLCFLLQAVVAWKLSGLLTTQRVSRLAITALFALAPPLLWRLHGHLSLMAHFLILAGIYLSWTAGPERPRRVLALVVIASAAVHAYILALVAAIWLASLADRLWRGERTIGSAGVEAALVFALTAIVCWQVGYFSIGAGVASGGYGFYRMNVLSLVDSDGWSRLLPSIPDGAGDYEGFNYLGLGVLLVAVFVAPAAWRARRGALQAVRSAPFSMLLAAGLTVFALSNRIGIGPIGLAVPLPDPVIRLADVFRSSGRMFWPVYYALLLVILGLLVRRFPPRVAATILVAATVVQIADTSAGWTFRRALLAEPSSRFQTPMTEPFWASAAERYDRVRWLMPMNHSPQWSVLSDYAVRGGMATDATFLARTGRVALAEARAQAMRRLSTGDFEPETLYVLDGESARAAEMVVSPDHMLATIDGFQVLAPNWRLCGTCPQAYVLDRAMLFGAVRSDEDVAFASEQGAPYRLSGWGGAEDWGVWSGDDIARLGFLEPLPARFRLMIDAQAFGPNVDLPFAFSAGLEPTLVRIRTERGLIAFDMSAAPGVRTIEIAVPQATSPRELGINDDERRLGLGLASFRIEPLPQP